MSLSVFSLVPDLLFDCSRVFKYAKIRTVLQSNSAWCDKSGRKSATQRQKFHTSDVKHCLHNKSGNDGVLNVNSFDIKYVSPADYGKVL